MTDRSRFAAPRYELPRGYVEVVSHDEANIRSQPQSLPVKLAAAKASSEATVAVTKAELVTLVSKRTGSTKKVATVVLNAMIQEIQGALLGGKGVRLTGLGNFTVAPTKASRGAAAMKVKTGGPKAGQRKTHVVSKTVYSAQFEPSQDLRIIDFAPAAPASVRPGRGKRDVV